MPPIDIQLTFHCEVEKLAMRVVKIDVSVGRYIFAQNVPLENFGIDTQLCHPNLTEENIFICMEFTPGRAYVLLIVCGACGRELNNS